MKTFKYKFSTLQKVLIALGLVLSAGGFVVNLIFCIRDGTGNFEDPTYKILQYVLLFFTTTLLFVLLSSVLLFSAYIVGDKYFKTRFGFIVSKFDVEKIESVTLDRKTSKLTVTFENGQYMVIVVKQEWYEDFIEALLSANPKIEYNIISVENTPDDELKK